MLGSLSLFILPQVTPSSVELREEEVREEAPPMTQATTEVKRVLKDIKTEVISKALTMEDSHSKVQEVMVNIWDFGGQQIYYTSHQTFLSSRAIYLLVTDISRPLDEVLETANKSRIWSDTGDPRTARGMKFYVL